MIDSKNRLTGSKNFERVKKEGKLYQRVLFGVSLLKREDKKPSRFGFIVSNKISKDAVHRNRVKRALREAVRQSATHIKKGYDVIFLAKTKIVRKSTEEIMREVKVSLKQIKLL
jgi:ribonuclease P protein component